MGTSDRFPVFASRDEGSGLPQPETGKTSVPEDEAKLRRKQRYEEKQKVRNFEDFYAKPWEDWEALFADRRSTKVICEKLGLEFTESINARLNSFRKEFFPTPTMGRSKRPLSQKAPDRARKEAVFREGSRLYQDLAVYCQKFKLDLKAVHEGNFLQHIFLLEGLHCGAYHSLSKPHQISNSRYALFSVPPAKDPHLPLRFIVLLLDVKVDGVEQKDIYFVPREVVDAFASHIYISLTPTIKSSASRDWEQYRAERGVALLKSEANKIEKSRKPDEIPGAKT